MECLRVMMGGVLASFAPGLAEVFIFLLPKKMELQNLKDIESLVTFDPNGLNRLYKLNLVNRFMNVKAENPSLNQDQICKMLGTSASSMKRVRADLQLNSPYRYDIPLKKNKKVKEKAAPPETMEKPKFRGRPKKEKLGLGKEAITDAELNNILSI